MKTEKLTPELKERLKNAKSIDELKAIAAEAGCELSDDELKGITGGLCYCPKDVHCEEFRDAFAEPTI